MKHKRRSHAGFHLLLCLLCFMPQMISPQTTSVTVRVGVLLEMDDYLGEMGLHCITTALSDFYAENGRHYQTRLELTTRNSKGDVIGAAAAALDLLKNAQVHAIIGPMYSTQASFLIALGHKAQVPVITFSATSPSLSSIRSPFFIRATLDDSSQVHAIGAIIQAYGWREVVPVYVNDEFGEGIIPYLTDALEQVNAYIPNRSVIHPQATDDQIVAELYKLMTMQTRVFVVHMESGLGSRLFAKAKEIGMMGEEYVWIVTDGIAYELNSMDHSTVELLRGVVGVQPHIPITGELHKFYDRYKARLQQNKSVNHTRELNIFGLWAYDSAIALAMSAEKALKNNATFGKVRSSTNTTDLEDIEVSDGGPKLIQALSSIKYEGLAGKFQLFDGQLRSPPFEIINVANSSVHVVGYWTKDHGIVRELSIPDVKTKRYSASKSNLGSITWPNGKTFPSKGWVIPTNGKKLKVLVPVKGGFTEYVRVTWSPDNVPKVEGYCIEVFDAMMKALPYGVPYEYVPYASPDHERAGTYNELTYEVYLGNYDAAAGDITILANRSQYVDFTLPFLASGVSMVVPVKEDKSKNAWVFLKPLTWELWLASFCSFVFIGFLIWILEHRINEDFRGPFWYQVGMIFWFAFSTMVFAHKEKVINNLSRFVLIIWFLVVLILTQSYTASLTSMLTVQQLQPTITDVNVLLASKDRVGYSRQSFVYGFLKSMDFDESRLVPFNSAEEMDQLLSKGSRNGGIAAAFHEIPYLKLFLSKYCSKYVMVDPTYKADGFGFVFPIGSPLVRDVSRAILNVTASREMVEIERKWLGHETKCLESTTINSPKSLGLRSFWGLFLIVGVVGIVAFMINAVKFLREHWHVIELSDTESTTWSKLVELLQRFDNRDLKSHTFKNFTHTDRDNRSAPPSSPENYLGASHFSQSSPGTNCPPSPMYSSPGWHATYFQGERECSEGEAFQIKKQEIELVNADENTKVARTAAHAS